MADYNYSASVRTGGAGSFGQNLGAGIENFVTGNIDYERQLEMLGFQNSFNAGQSALTRAFNAEEAKKNRDWQELMSNTAYQRAMADAKAAGINPSLIFSQGGASVGSGSSASAGSASSGSPVRGDSSSGLRAIVQAVFGLANTALKASAMQSQAELVEELRSANSYGNAYARYSAMRDSYRK